MVKRRDDSIKFTKIITRGFRGRLFRNVATMACFAFVAGTLLLTGLLVAGAQSGVQAGVDRLGPDMIVVPMDPKATSDGVFMAGRPTDLFFNSVVQEGVRSTPGVLKVSPQAYVGSLSNVSWCPTQVQVIAFDPSTDFTLGPLITESYDRPIKDYEIIVGSSVLGELGSYLPMYGIVFTIAGRLETTGSAIDQSIYMTLDKAYSLSSEYSLAPGEIVLDEGDISAVLVKIDGSYDLDSVMYWITLSNPGVLVFPMAGLGRELSDQLSITSQGLYLTVSMVVIVSLPLVVLISTMTVNERRREIGLMRAMGATQGFIFSIFFVEGIFLGLMGALVGVLGALSGLLIMEGALSSAVQTAIAWPPLFDILLQVSLAVLAAAIIAGGASLWPSLRASRMEPYEAIRSGQN
ncbi:MAG: ABC transporter permease [Methanomassiliicoccales archaeon]